MEYLEKNHFVLSRYSPQVTIYFDNKKYMNYELMVATAVSTETTAKKLFTEIDLTLKNNKASDIKEDYWGKRELAYPIKSKNSAFYSVFTFTIDASKVKDLTNSLNLNEKILRYLLVKLDK